MAADTVDVDISSHIQSQLKLTDTTEPTITTTIESSRLAPTPTLRYTAALTLLLHHLHTLTLIHQHNKQSTGANAAHLTASATSDSDHTSSSFHPIIALLNQYSTLQRQFTDLTEQRNTLLYHATAVTQQSQQRELNRVQTQIHAVITELNQSINTIKQHFDINSNNSTIDENYGKLLTDLTYVTTLFGGVVSEVQTGGTFDTLTQSVDSITTEQEALTHYKSLYDTARQQLTELTADMSANAAQFAASESGKKAEIESLTHQLKQLKHRQQYDIQHDNELTVSRMEVAHNLRVQNVAELQRRIGEAKQQIQMYKTVHAHTLQYVTGQCRQLDSLHDSWQHRYNGDVEEKTNAYDELTGRRSETAAQLAQLQKRYHDNKAYKVAHIAEAHQRGVNEQHDAHVLTIHCIAVNRIRFYWKVYWRQRSKVLAKLRKKRLAAARAKKLLAAKNPYLARQQEAAGKAKADAQAAEAQPQTV